MIGSKHECTPSTGNASGTTYEDYFVTVMTNVGMKIPEKDNFKGHPLVSGAFAFYCFSPFNCFPENHLPFLSINSLQVSDKRINSRTAAREETKKNKDDDRYLDASGTRGLTQD